MAIDPDLYEKVSGRRPNDAAYASAMLAGKGSDGSMSFLEARARGRRWLAVGTGVLVAVLAAAVLIWLFINAG